jgi:leukotriene-A4 hydrolase
MPDAVPSYLIALAVGDLAFKATGPRTGVYADKSVIKAAADEFADAESMIAAAEKSFGSYHWDRFDILVMPPGFPAGGMENPRLSFVSPTVIAGDKSLVSVIARGIGASWSGNLVTNATWRDLWLNEGFSGYLESRIMNIVYGEGREMMDRVLGLKALREDLATRNPKDQWLALDLRDRDPEEAFSSVPNEKGRLFLTYLDVKFGRERFDAFLRGYFDHFSAKTVTSEQFVDFLQEHLLDRYPSIVARDQVTAWVFGPGIPPDAVLPASDAFAGVDAARAAWTGGRIAAKKLESRAWVAQQWMFFLDGMPADLTTAQVAELDQTFGFARSSNAEVVQRWLLLAIRHQYQPSAVRLEEYLKSIGRRKLIVPLYREMMETPAGATQARRVYALARPHYHASTAAGIDAIVNPQSDSSETPDE